MEGVEAADSAATNINTSSPTPEHKTHSDILVLLLIWHTVTFLRCSQFDTQWHSCIAAEVTHGDIFVLQLIRHTLIFLYCGRFDTQWYSHIAAYETWSYWFVAKSPSQLKPSEAYHHTVYVVYEKNVWFSALSLHCEEAKP